jgi:hypothetical protein
MSLLSYNGITLQVCRFLHGCERTPVYDGPQYLYTHWRINCRCLYNPQATSFDYPIVADVAGSPGPFAAPKLPADTDQNIRGRLMTPRKQLILGVGRVAWLVSPQQGFTIDSANGPTPLACNVIRGPGGRSFVVDFQIETKLRECNLEKTFYPSIFLSHRWEMSHTLDEDFFTTRVIKGHVIFDTARLAQGAVLPDQYRGALFHPIPNNCQRRIPVVKQHADGNTVAYVILDEEQEVNLGSAAVFRNITNIDATHEASMGVPGDLKTIMGAVAFARTVLGGMRSGGRQGYKAGLKISGPRAAKPAGFVAGALVGGLGAGLSGFENVIGYMPLLTHTIALRIQGNGLATKSDLYAAGYNIIASRITSLNLTFEGSAYFGGWESSVSFDLKHRTVEMTAQIVTAAKSLGNLAFPIDLPNGKDVFVPAMPAMPMRGDVPFASTIVGLDASHTWLAPGSGAKQNALPPGDGKSRGTFLESLTYQALLDPCNPQATPYATDALAAEPVNLPVQGEGAGLPAPFQLPNVDQATKLPIPAA